MVKIRNPFRRGRHRPNLPRHRAEVSPRILACCVHCRHPYDDLPHLTACPWGCHQPGADIIALAVVERPTFLGPAWQPGIDDHIAQWADPLALATSSWPPDPGNDGWLDKQLAASAEFLAAGRAYVERWHRQFVAGVAEVDRWIVEQAGALIDWQCPACDRWFTRHDPRHDLCTYCRGEQAAAVA